ncbi:EAL domain-containing protein [Geoalkalibacter subterraneus]|uniref:EAL domain-containing protein n=1 Tax=Geoalkalibacter subterraneus TaxID=483547 RepID=A0A0B5FTX5_9BACT|nr:EAL domain-containing protein [Geoalkalibacter subterraneus]AJF08134.1 hypothetical protein GSUB_16635 [Geoalkalibacter subterraneus]
MEFGVYFQKIMITGRGQTSVFAREALIRGPVGSPVESPINLFAFARLKGRLASIDVQIMKTACRVFAANDPGGKLFLNMFPESILSEEFDTQEFLTILNDINLEPKRIVIEVLESERIVDCQAIKTKLFPLENKGVELALDDFGTGFADLQKWIELCPTYIKCDRNLLVGAKHDARRGHLLKAIETMCKGTNTLMIAEGIETEEEEAWLKAHTSIFLVQGFRYHIPQPIDPNEHILVIEDKPCAHA